MESAVRLLLVILILVILFGVPLYLCFRGMAKQARLGNVDRFNTGQPARLRLTGFGLALFFPLVPIMVIRQDWIFAIGIALLAGTICVIGLRSTGRY